MSDEVNPGPTVEQEETLPPASFETLVRSVVMQAQFSLVSFDDDKGHHGPELTVARHYIDLLSMLSDKTRGNLSMEEQRVLENSLTELRFRYVQALEDSRKSAAQAQA